MGTGVLRQAAMSKKGRSREGKYRRGLGWGAKGSGGDTASTLGVVTEIKKRLKMHELGGRQSALQEDMVNTPEMT